MKGVTMFGEIRRRNAEVRRYDEETRSALANFNPDARIQPKVVDKMAQELAVESLSNENPFNPDARLVMF